MLVCHTAVRLRMRVLAPADTSLTVDADQEDPEPTLYHSTDST